MQLAGDERMLALLTGPDQEIAGAVIRRITVTVAGSRLAHTYRFRRC